ncbi:hypothetical protein [uncultured Marivirga sp.]|uniref:hypothetical protein n=1 Tax=uncultured Marivirga sp. TaxID=1123707 RepID=UPI0030EBD35A|tara:strand:- start:128812 stop:130989 length:2178 start_codon:yes stop_codon:yes gene_type:complete
MHKGFSKYWNQYKWRFNLRRALIVGLPLASSIVLLLALGNIFNIKIPFAFWVVYTISVLALLIIWNPKLLWTSEKLLAFLHQEYEEFEYSLSLFFKNDLNALDKLQLEKVFKQFPSSQHIKFPLALKNVSLLLIFSILFYLLSFIIQIDPQVKNRNVSHTKDAVLIQDSTAEKTRLEFGFKIFVYPPKYTGLKDFQWQKDQKIPEGSRLVFKNNGNIHFDLLWQNQYNFNLKSKESKTFTVIQPSIFQIEYEQKDSIISMQPVVLEITRDNPPVLSTNLKDNRHEIGYKDLRKGFELDLKLEDDYGIVSSDIIMTLSRGEGEAVRFREMKQSLSGISTKVRAQQKNISLPLDTFSLEPGDELYFYFSAKDNKDPRANTGRTDVYFLSVADTSEQELVEYEGFALTNEAEYFKSQRQIIIDTEALLADKNQISLEEFEKRSNNIGADQKLLRLRYGVFLGEEFETTGGLGEIDHSGHNHGELTDEDEENHNEDVHEGHEHESEGNFSNPIFNETPELEAYVHAHDDSELSTFLDANVKVKLKEALANMWEAELFLRTYKPSEALPFEYNALKLIKEVKRASRIYVERMGFEPPPIDEEKKRLTGELDKINAETTQRKRGEKLFDKYLFETYSLMNKAYQQEDLSGARDVASVFTDKLVIKITSEPVRYGSLLAAVKKFQYSESKAALRAVLNLMEDVLNLKELEAGRQSSSIESSLHSTYYELENE